MPHPQQQQSRRIALPERTEHAVERIVTAGVAVAECTRAETELEDARPLQKVAAIQRLLQGDNPLTGKPHSATSAEALVATDPAYAAYRARQREAVMMRIQSEAAYEAAKLHAYLAVRCYAAGIAL